MELSKLTLEIFSRLEMKWLMECSNERSSNNQAWSPSKKKEEKTRILSIDGGDLVAGEVLVYLEDQIKAKSSNPEARIPDFFDIIAGTGMGGVLAVLLTVSNPGTGRPLFSAREAVDFLQSNHRDLFRPAGFFRRRSRKFSASSFERVLRDALRGSDGRALTLRDACKPLLIPCYDLNTSAPFVFSRADASDSPSFDFDLWRVCRATSATPGLFKPFKLASIDGRTSCAAIDGGLVMNNPAAAAVTHVLHNKREFPFVSGVEDLAVLSLGKGPPSRRLSGSPRCSGAAVIGIVLDGVSGTVDQILGNAFCWNPSYYVRIQANGPATEEKDGLKTAGERMLSEKGLETLPFGGKRLLKETNGELIEAFVHRLGVSQGDGKDSASPLSGWMTTVSSDNCA
ncbi:hypothetical protein J5N97_012967 [Dioscorea zingiberensis]|uniref:Patatin n=1 Tax=Dioscorea zingiberensis TaxID=325984 RepID=A0A9D5HIC3_9LILI|nr:hypothetical protein J5N97_012967 [Dioscorea zingiberensis]